MSLEVNQDPLQILPQETCVKIFENFSSKDLGACLQVSKYWNAMLSKNDYWNTILEFQGIDFFKEFGDEICKKAAFDRLYQECQVTNWNNFYKTVDELVKNNRPKHIVVGVIFLYSQAMKFELEVFSNNNQANVDTEKFIFISNHKEKPNSSCYSFSSYGSDKGGFYNLNIELRAGIKPNAFFLEKRANFMQKYFINTHKQFEIMHWQDKEIEEDNRS